jgi:predicted phage terminase large subunit-like protein
MSGAATEPKKYELDGALKLLEKIDPREYKALLELTDQIERLEQIEKAKTDFLTFVKMMWPGVIIGPHHKTMARVIEGVVLGDKKRSVVNMAPRMSKSEFFSCFMPAWYLGHNPDKKIIQICGNSDMAIGWSRKVRNLVASEEYQKIFPGVGLRADSKSAGRWHTSHNGEYFAVGAEGNVTGKGGDIVIIDDPTGEQQAITALTDPSVYRKCYDWYVAGPRQRLQPGGRICVVQSRWSVNDFTGQLLKAEREAADSPFADKWEVIELPAILNGKSIWPEFWPFEYLEATRVSLPPHRWNAQYLQQPGSAESALLKREYWKRWEPRKPPEVQFKLVTMDTAYSDKETADFTAVTTWGVFHGEAPPHYDKFGKLDPGGKELDCLILLDAWKDRINFPDLKNAAHKHYLKWMPDIFLIEAKASGVPLLHELRARGIPVSEYTPVRGSKASPNNKIVRANAVTDILASGMVYAPNVRWAEDVIEECDQFPEGLNDDFVDCVVMALMRFRQGGLIQLPSDDWGEPQDYRRKRKFY